MAQTRTSPEGITQQLAKALAHPLRVRILTSLHKGISSPNQLSQELGEPLGNVSYHVKTLLEYDCVELVKTEPRRGAVEHFYRATERAFFSDTDWAKIPASARKGITGVDPRDGRPGRHRGADRRHDRRPHRLPRQPHPADPRRAGLDRASPPCSPRRSNRAIEIQEESATRLAEDKADAHLHQAGDPPLRDPAGEGKSKK